MTTVYRPAALALTDANTVESAITWAKQVDISSLNRDDIRVILRDTGTISEIRFIGAAVSTKVLIDTDGNDSLIDNSEEFYDIIDYDFATFHDLEEFTYDWYMDTLLPSFGMDHGLQFAMPEMFTLTSEYDAMNTTHTATIAERDATIAELQATVTSIEETTRALVEAESATTIATLTSENVTHEATISSLEGQLAAMQVQLDATQTALTNVINNG